MYKHLFFDLDNTVWNFDLNSRHAMHGVYSEYGLPLDIFGRFFEVYNRHNDRLWELYRRNEIDKPVLASRRFDLTLEEFGIRHIPGGEFNARYLELMPGQTRLCDGARQVIERLAARFKLYIITNGFKEVQYKKLENTDLRRFFSRVYISEEVRSAKPSPEIFLYALKSSNARKKESLMIGDSWEVDILGAMDAGMDQVHYTPSADNTGFTEGEKERIDASATRTYRISALDGLFGILKIPVQDTR